MLRKIQTTQTVNRSFLSRYRIPVTIVMVIVLGAILWQPVKDKFFSTLEHNSDSNQSIEQIPSSVLVSTELSTPPNNATEGAVVASNSDEENNNDLVNEYVLASGDTLAKILESYNIGFSEVWALTKQFPALENQLRPGQVISWAVDDEGHLSTLTWTINRKESRVYEKTAEGFVENIEKVQSDYQEVAVGGAIGDGGNNTFIGSAQLAGLTTTERYNAARFLEYQVSFKGLRLGDKFSVLVERELVNDEHIGSRFLAAKIRNRGRDHYAIYNEKYRGYYDENGAPLAEGFLRIPTIKEKKFRISSHFNPSRLHPITKKVSPHNGVDYAMPVGTPLVASGDGEVLIARYSNTAGNYVAIRHGKQYVTRYLHMHKLMVKPGQIVKRGDIIGLSGNTGRSTGPHLHYEFLSNNKPVNPVTINLPRPEGLKGEDLTEFKALVKEIQEKLDNPVYTYQEALTKAEIEQPEQDVPSTPQTETSPITAG